MADILDINAFAALEPSAPRAASDASVPDFDHAEALLAAYDRLGIARGVVNVQVSPEWRVCTQSNGEIAALAARHASRLLSAFCLEARNYNNEAQSAFDGGIRWYRAKGCRLMAEVNPSLRLSDERVQALLAAAAAENMPVLARIAPFTGLAGGLVDAPGLPQLDATLARLPALRLIGTGQAFWAELSAYRGQAARFAPAAPAGARAGALFALMKRHTGLYCCLSGAPGAAALAAAPDRVFELIRTFPGRVLFGSGIASPAADEAAAADILARLRAGAAVGAISADALAGVLGGNAAALLGL